MSKTNKIVIIFLLSIPGILISYVLFYLLESLLIPDDCMYHSETPPWLINVLFDFPSSNGGHPYPSNFQFGLIFFFGILFSFLFVRRLLNKK